MSLETINPANGILIKSEMLHCNSCHFHLHHCDNETAWGMTMFSKGRQLYWLPTLLLRQASRVRRQI